MAFHRDDSFVEDLEDNPEMGSVDRMGDTLVVPDKTDLAEDNLDNDRVVDKGRAVVDNLGFVVESELAVVVHLVYPVDLELEALD